MTESKSSLSENSETEKKIYLDFFKKTKENIAYVKPDALYQYYCQLLNDFDEAFLTFLLADTLQKLKEYSKNIPDSPYKDQLIQTVQNLEEGIDDIENEELPLALEIVQRLKFKVEVDHRLDVNHHDEEKKLDTNNISYPIDKHAITSLNNEIYFRKAVIKAQDSHSLRRIASSMLLFLAATTLTGTLLGLSFLSGAALPALLVSIGIMGLLGVYLHKKVTLPKYVKIPITALPCRTSLFLPPTPEAKRSNLSSRITPEQISLTPHPSS